MVGNEWHTLLTKSNNDVGAAFKKLSSKSHDLIAYIDLINWLRDHPERTADLVLAIHYSWVSEKHYLVSVPHTYNSFYHLDYGSTKTIEAGAYDADDPRFRLTMSQIKAHDLTHYDRHEV